MRSLFWKVFAANLLTLLVALGTVSFLLASTFRALYYRRTSQNLITTAKNMASQLEPLLADPARRGEVETLRIAMEQSTGTQICVLGRGAAHREVFGMGPLGEQAETPGPGAGQAEAGETGVVPPGVALCGQEMLIAHWPFRDRRGSPWSLYVRASMAGAVDETVWELRKLLLKAVVAAVAVSLLVALGLSVRIAGPLRRMRRLATVMAGGDFSQRMGLKEKDEVGDLARSFDSLADSLQRTLGDLRQEQARLRGILASVAEGIIAVDGEGRVTLLNPQAAALLGLDQAETVGRAIGDLPASEQVSRQFIECLQGNRLCTAEFELSHPRRSLVLHVAPVRAGEGERWGAVAVVRDVTTPRRLEAMRRQFISDASHEIRTPLTSIGGFAAAIADGTAATPEQRTRGAALIVREVERLNRLVDDLLDLSRIESGAVALKLAEVDVGELIRAAVEAFEAEAREKRIHVELDLARDLPAVRADSDRVYQVLANLLSNALRFNRADGKIAIAAWETDGQVRVEVQDTGAGIAAEQLPNIWERFHRADSSRARDEGGTGLGLAIVRSIVQAHGGEVQADSEPGKGSTFSFTLPIT
jgi:PAS domain S-box-containing protein